MSSDWIVGTGRKEGFKIKFVKKGSLSFQNQLPHARHSRDETKTIDGDTLGEQILFNI